MRIVQTEPENGGLAATWSDGTTSYWPGSWLGDQCACPECRHPSGQRLFEIGDLPERPEIERAAIRPDGSVGVVWRDEAHASTYSLTFLQQHGLKAGQAASVTLWGSGLA